MEITLHKNILSAMLQDAAELGATSALSQHGLIKPNISKQEAYRKYGSSDVKRWISEGLIELVKDGSTSAKYRISRAQIDAVSKVSNRPSYQTVKERT